ncbi:MAG TPA: radical SAM protein [Myxococcota bacterium]|nr:radical SAM protein [Myxococcota bacterium]HQK52511.1 radical SAM protein [Myxococcota bacterium]
MFVRNYRTDFRYYRVMGPILWRLARRSLGASRATWRAGWQAWWIGLRQGIPARLRARRDGVPSPVTLQVVDDVACRAGCAHCTFLGFADHRSRLSLGDLDRLFGEARAMGITQVYLMGADPFYRADADDLLALLARHRGQFFLLFTEGRRVGAGHLDRIAAAGNIVPVLNIDGLGQTTDRRKGPGAFEAQQGLMVGLRQRKVPFLVTTMIHRENHDEVTSLPFLRWLEAQGAWLVAYVPYVPVDPKGDFDLVLDAGRREALFDRAMALNRQLGRLAVMDLLGIEQRLTACPAGVFSLTVWHDGTLAPCPAVALGMSGSNIHQRPLWEAFRDDPLYRALRERHREAEARGERLHCQFFTDPAFLRDFVARHRSEVQVLSPGALRVLGVPEPEGRDG